MKPEEQRIAIAEACGWKPYQFGSGWTQGASQMDIGPKPLPDYLNDLNEMHEAEKVLTDNQKCNYTAYLQNMVKSFLGEFNLVHATASQRAEAFLKTIGKWRD